MNILISGGSGFIGGELLKRLDELGHTATLLTRWPERVRHRIPQGVQAVQWDGKTMGGWRSYVEKADAVVNLAGESIGTKRWTRARKLQIISSRVDATRAIVQGIAAATRRPSVFLNASAVGYYGSVQSGDVTEDHPKGEGFLAEVCDSWEKEASEALAESLRLVLFRMAVVLGERGGALQRMLLPFRLYVGGPLGSGEQWFPWVHRDDVVSAILFALDNARLSGPVNVSAPGIVRMREFCSVLGQALGKPSWFRVPPIVLRVALGQMAEMVLDGQKVVPSRLTQAGFTFRFPDLASAFRDVLRG